jgi:hypothetical protein
MLLKSDMVRLKFVDAINTITSGVTFLATRTRGQQCLTELESLLKNIQDNSVLLISLDGVLSMDVSFTDEVFGTLASQQARGQSDFAPIILVDVNESCLMELDVALETRPDREDPALSRLRNCVLPVIVDEQLTLIGKVENHVRESFELLMNHDELTARLVSDLLDLSLNAASTRLKTLSDLRLAQRKEIRDEQGKQYVYRALT